MASTALSVPNTLFINQPLRSFPSTQRTAAVKEKCEQLNQRCPWYNGIVDHIAITGDYSEEYVRYIERVAGRAPKVIRLDDVFNFEKDTQQQLEEYIDQEGIEHIGSFFPTKDLEEFCERLGLTYLAPPPEVAYKARDKQWLARVCEHLDIPTPPTRLLKRGESMRVEHDAFIKPQEGAGGLDTYVVEAGETVKAKEMPVVVQKKINIAYSPSVQVHFFDGQPFALTDTDQILEGEYGQEFAGIGMPSEKNSPETQKNLLQYSQRLGDHLSYHYNIEYGRFGLDWVFDQEDGSFYAIDLNLREGGASAPISIMNMFGFKAIRAIDHFPWEDTFANLEYTIWKAGLEPNVIIYNPPFKGQAGVAAGGQTHEECKEYLNYLYQEIAK